jgi:integrase
MRPRGSIVAKGDGKWLVRVGGGAGLDGTRVTKSLTVTGTRSEAKRALAQLVISMDTGGHITVAAAVEKWLKLRVGTVSESSMIKHESSVKRVLAVAPKFASMQAAKVLPSDIDALTQLLLTRGRDLSRPHSKNKSPSLSARTVKSMLIVIGQVFDMLQKDQIIERNPVKLAHSISMKDSGAGRHLEPHELTAVLDYFRSHWINPILLLLLGTGARRSEVLALRWSDLDLAGGFVSLSKTLKAVQSGWVVGAPKTRAGTRRVKLPQFAIDVLMEHRKTQQETYARLGSALPFDGVVFPAFDNPTAPIRPDSVTHVFNAGLKTLGIVGATLHSIRHTAATALIGQVPLPSLAARMGHRDSRVTLMIYAHALKENEDAAAGMMDDFHNSHTNRTPATVVSLEKTGVC